MPSWLWLAQRRIESKLALNWMNGVVWIVKASIASLSVECNRRRFFETLLPRLFQDAFKCFGHHQIKIQRHSKILKDLPRCSTILLEDDLSLPPSPSGFRNSLTSAETGEDFLNSGWKLVWIFVSNSKRKEKKRKEKLTMILERESPHPQTQAHDPVRMKLWD